jgi:tetratricopeptide (TPR) repeat protein
MLETIREYAQLRLAAAGETQPLRRQHAAYYLELAERAEPELAGPQQVEWLEQLEDEHDNFRAALAWALQAREPETALRIGAALWRFWWGRGYLSEGRRWLDQALNDVGVAVLDLEAGQVKAQKAMRAKGLNAAGVLAFAQEDHDGAEASNAMSLSLFRELEDQLGAAKVLNNLGSIAQERGDLVQARAYMLDSLSIRQLLGDTLGSARTLLNLGLVALEQADYGQSKIFFDQAMSIVRSLGDIQMLGIVLVNCGELALRQTNYSAASSFYTESLAIQRKLGNRELIAHCLEGLAASCGEQNQAIKAVTLWGAAEALRDIASAPLDASNRGFYEPFIAALHTQIDQAEWDHAWAAGRELSTEQAIELAMSA